MPRIIDTEHKFQYNNFGHYQKRYAVRLLPDSTISENSLVKEVSVWEILRKVIIEQLDEFIIYPWFDSIYSRIDPDYSTRD